MYTTRDTNLFLVIDDHAEAPGAHLYHPDFGYISFWGVPEFAVEDMLIADDEEVEYRNRFGFTYSNDDMRRIFETHDRPGCCPGDCEEMELMDKRRDLITDYILMYPNVPPGEEGTDRINEEAEESFREDLKYRLGWDSSFAEFMQNLVGSPAKGFHYVDNVDRAVEAIDTTDGAIAYPIRVGVFTD